MTSGITWIKKGVRIAVPLVLLIFIGKYILRDWDRFREAFQAASVPLLILSQIGFLLGTLTIALAWHQMLRILGSDISLSGSLKSFYLSILGKYIPGKVWGAAGRVYFAREENVPEGTAMLGVLLETVLLMVSAGTVGSLTMTMWPITLPWTVRYLPLLLLGTIVLIHPAVLHRIIPVLSRRFPERMIQPAKLPDFRTMLMLTGIYSSIWVFWGLGFYCAISGVADLPCYRNEIEYFVPMVGCNTLAWLAGFVTVIAPAGFGIREVVLMSLTAGSVGAGPAALAAVLARIFTLTGEMTGALVFVFLHKCGYCLDRKRHEC